MKNKEEVDVLAGTVGVTDGDTLGAFIGKELLNSRGPCWTTTERSLPWSLAAVH